MQQVIHFCPPENMIFDKKTPDWGDQWAFEISPNFNKWNKLKTKKEKLAMKNKIYKYLNQIHVHKHIIEPKIDYSIHN
jgi:hypothetical protein